MDFNIILYYIKPIVILIKNLINIFDFLILY
jgi:hypothetical protein